jgi:hypothetical protein
LPAPDLEAQLARPGVDLRLEVLERPVAVDAGIAPPEQVEVDAVEHVDAHGPDATGAPAISSSSARRTSASGTSTPHAASRRVEEDEPRRAALGLLVARERGPGRVRVDGDGLGREHVLHDAALVREAREPQRRQEPERDRAAVRQRVARGRLERVGERVAEVELRRGPRSCGSARQIADLNAAQRAPAPARRAPRRGRPRAGPS